LKGTYSSYSSELLMSNSRRCCCCNVLQTSYLEVTQVARLIRNNLLKFPPLGGLSKLSKSALLAVVVGKTTYSRLAGKKRLE